MTPPLDVVAPLALRPRLRLVWASLPLSVRERSAGQDAVEHSTIPYLAAVDGQQPGWLGDLETAVESGAGGVVLVRPSVGVGASAGSLSRIAASADARGICVVVDTMWAANPGVDDLRRVLAAGPAGAGLEGVALVDSVVTVEGVDAPLLDQVIVDHLGLLRALGIRLTAVRHRRSDPDGYNIICSAGSTMVVLAGVRDRGGRDDARVAVHGLATEAILTVPGPGTARPASAVHVTGRGTWTAPARYESASRAQWRRLQQAVRAGSAVNHLHHLALDLALLEPLGQLMTPARPPG